MNSDQIKALYDAEALVRDALQTLIDNDIDLGPVGDVREAAIKLHDAAVLWAYRAEGGEE